MIDHAPDRPWTPDRSRACVRGHIVVKMAAGEAPDGVPHYLDVAAGRRDAPTRLDGGPVDRALRRWAPAMRVSRAFRPARGDDTWDDLEQETGLARTFRIDVDPDVNVLDLLDELAAVGVVETAEPTYLSVTPFAVAASRPPSDRVWAHRMVGADAALSFEAGDRALIVAVVDTGVDLVHPELALRLRPGFDTVHLPRERVSPGVTLLGDVTTPDRIPRDEMGHGTACAGIIAAQGRRVPPGIGGAAQLLPARALASARIAGRRSLTAVGGLPDIDEAVKSAVDLGARVLNLSFGTPQTALREDDPEPHAGIVEYARRRGCILVAASGNDGTDTKYFPAAHEGVIAVGAVGAEGLPAAFSSRGPHVALSAPGEHVFTATVGGYATNTGTSFAAPFVAGACALLFARAARYGVPLSAADARRILTTSARPFARGQSFSGSGTGVLDVPAALRQLEHELVNPPMRIPTRISA